MFGIQIFQIGDGGGGGGSGTAQDPFLGFAAADAAAVPGDLFLIHAGVYPGGVDFKKSGEAGKPIIWRGAGDGGTVVDGGDPDRKKEERAVTASGALDAGVKIAGFNDGFAARAPDLGAYEYGTPVPHHGPRTKKSEP